MPAPVRANPSRSQKRRPAGIRRVHLDVHPLDPPRPRRREQGVHEPPPHAAPPRLRRHVDARHLVRARRAVGAGTLDPVRVAHDLARPLGHERVAPIVHEAQHEPLPPVERAPHRREESGRRAPLKRRPPRRPRDAPHRAGVRRETGADDDDGHGREGYPLREFGGRRGPTSRSPRRTPHAPRGSPWTWGTDVSSSTYATAMRGVLNA